MERESFFSPREAQRKELDEYKIIDGVKYRKVDTGYTIREFYSHSTPEKGPGPGWDSKMHAFKKYGVDDVSELPNDPYLIWEEVDEEEK
jgi:hypothetical protein